MQKTSNKLGTLPTVSVDKSKQTLIQGGVHFPGYISRANSREPEDVDEVGYDKDGHYYEPSASRSQCGIDCKRNSNAKTSLDGDENGDPAGDF